MISIVGEELQSSLRVPARVFARLEALKVRVEMISYGATRNNLCFLVPRERLREVVLELHRELFEA
jgi:aspartokinase